MRAGVNWVSESRHRCPKTGRWMGEMDCMYCNDPPDDDYEFCWVYNVVDPEGEIPFKSRWDNKGRDRRKIYV